MKHIIRGSSTIDNDDLNHTAKCSAYSLLDLAFLLLAIVVSHTSVITGICPLYHVKKALVYFGIWGNLIYRTLVVVSGSHAKECGTKT